MWKAEEWIGDHGETIVTLFNPEGTAVADFYDLFFAEYVANSLNELIR